MAPVAAPPRCAAYPTCTRPGVGSRPYHAWSQNTISSRLHAQLHCSDAEPEENIELYKHFVPRSFCKLQGALHLMQYLQRLSMESCRSGLPWHR